MLLNAGIGIDIHPDHLHIVCLKGVMQGERLAGEARFPVDSANSKTDRQADIASFINDFIREQGISGADLFIGIPAGNVIFREIELPLAVKENLTATLVYEIEKYLPFSEDDIYFDAPIRHEDKARNRMKVLLVAVKREILDAFLGIAANIGQGVSGITPAALGLADYWYYRRPDDRGNLVLVLRGEKGWDTAVVLKDGALCHAKSLALEDGLQLEGRLRELREAFFEKTDAVRLVVVGGQALEGLVDVFTEISAEALPDDPSHPAHGLSHAAALPAFGLALGGIRPSRFARPNLMPVRLRKKQNRVGLYVMAALVLALALACGAWAGSLLWRQHQEMLALDAEWNRLKTQVPVVERMAEETRGIREQVQYLRTLRPGDVYVIEILRELSDILPTGAYVTDFNLIGDKLTLYGMADAAAELITLLEKSPLFKDAAFLSAIRNSREGKEMFRIGCGIQTD